MPEISTNGVFFDTKVNKVVDSQPEEGVQLVAPGTEVTDAAKADIARYRDLEVGAVAEPETVTTDAAADDAAAETPPPGRAPRRPRPSPASSPIPDVRDPGR